MSCTIAEVIHDGKVIGYTLYHGTCDFLKTAVSPTIEPVQEAWREWPFKDCTCGQPPVSCFVWTSYGGDEGWYVPWEMCITCMALTGGWEVHGVGEFFCTDEYAHMCRKYGCKHWPKDGHPIALETTVHSKE